MNVKSWVVLGKELNQFKYIVMEEFQKDLIELFNKHNILVLKDSVSIDFSPLFYNKHEGIFTRDITFKFTQLMKDREEAKEHIDKYGFKVRNFY